jgi:hypothetical protein
VVFVAFAPQTQHLRGRTGLVIQSELPDLFVERSCQPWYWGELSSRPVGISGSTRHQKPPLLDRQNDTPLDSRATTQSVRPAMSGLISIAGVTQSLVYGVLSWPVRTSHPLGPSVVLTTSMFKVTLIVAVVYVRSTELRAHNQKQTHRSTRQLVAMVCPQNSASFRF